MAAARRRQLRLSRSFDLLLQQAGLGLSNESTVLRALIVLGLAHAGIAIDTLRPDLLRLHPAELSPQIKRSLGELYAEWSASGVQLYAEQSTAVEDPYLATQAVQAFIGEAEEALSNPLDVGLEF
jgi:hypothetical protein